MKRYILAVVTALLVLSPWHEAVRAGALLYTVQNLGSFSGAVPTITGINASGQVAGNVPANGSQAVRYTDGFGWQGLPGLDRSFSVATGINASGDVVGYHITSAGQFRAFRYRDAFGYEDIPPLPGGTMTLGFAINDLGDVVGYSDSTQGVVPFRAAIGLLPVALPSLNGGMAYACGINTSGQVAGISNTAAGAQHGFRDDDGATLAIDIASPDGAANTVATCAIDEAGRVGGQADRTGGVTHAVRYTDAGGTIDLDTFGSSSSNVESIAGGLSVGWYMASNGSLHAFAHRDADGSFDLNTRIDAPGWVLAQAKAVNANGVIAGEGTLNGAAAVFRLTPQAPNDTTPPVISIVTATPSSIFPPAGQLVPVTIAVSATDDSGTAPVCTLSSITGPGSSPTDFNITGALSGTVLAVGGRTYTFTATCVDAGNNSASSSASVFVVPDTTAPVIRAVSATPSNLWPPDNRLVPVTVSVQATDDVDTSPTCALSSITGFTGTSDDAAITGPFAATLRAVGGRTYSLNVRCFDAAGNASTASASVVVPPDVTAPDIQSLSAAPGSIWPANNKWVSVAVSVSARDNVDASPACALTGITGGPSSDAVLTGQFTGNVRAVRNADGSVRTYLFHVTCNDAAGNASEAEVSVSVSKDTPSKVYLHGRRSWGYANLPGKYGRYRR